MTIPNYKIINKTNSDLKVELTLEPSLVYFDGHFDGFPILPAVAQLFIVEQIAKKELLINTEFKDMKKVKFRNPIKPNMTIFINLQYDKEKKYLTFSYNDENNGLLSSGRLI